MGVYMKQVKKNFSFKYLVLSIIVGVVLGLGIANIDSFVQPTTACGSNIGAPCPPDGD